MLIVYFCETLYIRSKLVYAHLSILPWDSVSVTVLCKCTQCEVIYIFCRVFLWILLCFVYLCKFIDFLNRNLLRGYHGKCYFQFHYKNLQWNQRDALFPDEFYGDLLQPTSIGALLFVKFDSNCSNTLALSLHLHKPEISYVISGWDLLPPWMSSAQCWSNNLGGTLCWMPIALPTHTPVLGNVSVMWVLLWHIGCGSHLLRQCSYFSALMSIWCHCVLKHLLCVKRIMSSC